jgi:hypothetical protein
MTKRFRGGVLDGILRMQMNLVPVLPHEICSCRHNRPIAHDARDEQAERHDHDVKEWAPLMKNPASKANGFVKPLPRSSNGSR